MYLHPHRIRPRWVGIISRPKLSGVGRQVGVILPDGCVAQLIPSEVGLASLDEFSQGWQITYDKGAPVEYRLQILWRAYESVGRMPACHAASFNCECYTRLLMGEKPESSQVQAERCRNQCVRGRPDAGALSDAMVDAAQCVSRRSRTY